MPLLLLLCLSLACLPLVWPTPLAAQVFTTFSPWHSLAGTLAVISAMTLAAAFITRVTCRGLSGAADARRKWVRFYGRWRTWYALGQLAAFVFILYGCGWGWAVQSVLRDWHGGPPLPPGCELLILAPLPIMMACAWLWF